MLKKLSNKGEQQVYEQLAPTAGSYGAGVYRKVRIADVIDINTLPERGTGTYALQAHFDFIVADEHERPLFAVEFDGSGHSDKNDVRKDEICRSADLAIFRVDLQCSRIETARIKFLSYLVHLWFLGTKFVEMQEAGDLPLDEAFMISGFLKADAKHIFDSEFDLLGPARGKLNRHCRKNEVPGGPMWHLQVSEALLSHEAMGYAAYASMPVGGTNLCGRAVIGLKIPCAGRLAHVPFSLHEIGQFCTAQAIEDLVEEITLFQSGAGHVLRLRDDVLHEVQSLRRAGYVTLLASHGKDDDFAKAIRG